MFMVFLAKKTIESSPTREKWLCWMSVYQLQDIEVCGTMSSSTIFVCNLGEVRADSVPTLIMTPLEARVTLIGADGMLHCFGIPNISIVPRLKKSNHVKESETNEQLLNTRALEPHQKDEKRLPSLEDESHRITNEEMKQGKGGEEDMGNVFSNNYILRKSYNVPTMGVTSGTLFTSRSNGQFEYLVIDPTSLDPQTLPIMIPLIEPKPWSRSMRDEAMASILEKEQQDEVLEEGPDPGFQTRFCPGTLCQTCSSILHSSDLLRHLPIWTGTTASYIIVAPGEMPEDFVWGKAWVRIHCGDHQNARATQSNQNWVSRDGSAGISIPGLQVFQDEHYAHYKSLQSLAESILRGCHLCAIFWGHMSPTIRKELDDTLNRSAGQALYNTDTRKDQFLGFPVFDPESSLQKFISPQRLNVQKGNKWFRPLEKDDHHLCVRMCLRERRKEEVDIAITLYSPESETKPLWEADTHVRRYTGKKTDLERERPQKAGLPQKNASVNEDSVKPEHESEDTPSSVGEGRPSTQGRGSRKSKKQAIFGTRFTSSPETFNLARQWLLSCLATHSCSFPHSQGKPPTRIIDTMPLGPTLTKLQIRLTTPEDEGMPYLALSHCWGPVSTPTLKLTDQNFDRLVRGFESTELPATFRDAVSICKALGLRYLWIDSLCIIQGNAEDWKKEASAMADVYGNAVCTIAAESSTSTQSGCFAARNQLHGQQLAWKDKEGKVFAIRGVKVKQSNLHTRGWVFQERLLSPRTLSFTSTGIAWHCRRTTADESDTGGSSQVTDWATGFRFKETMAELTRPIQYSLARGANRKAFLMAWFEIVEEYVKLGLTQSSDKLIAIAGIASKISQTTGLSYYYGLWNDIHDPTMFMCQLLWAAYEQAHWTSCYSPADDISRPPTFSWAAVFGTPVEHYITFHDRIGDGTAAMHNMSRSTFMAGTKDTDENEQDYFEILLRKGQLSITAPTVYEGRPSDIFSKTNLSFPTRLERLCSPHDSPLPDVTIPMIILTGPVRNIYLKRLENQRWDYPWPRSDDQVDDEDSDQQSSDEWFYQDFNHIHVRAKCLTIAKWRRAWNGRWYAAGLVLGACHWSLGRKSGKVQPMMRLGYFEHSWSSKHVDWEDHGMEETVFLV